MRTSHDGGAGKLHAADALMTLPCLDLDLGINNEDELGQLLEAFADGAPVALLLSLPPLR